MTEYPLFFLWGSIHLNKQTNGHIIQWILSMDFFIQFVFQIKFFQHIIDTFNTFKHLFNKFEHVHVKVNKLAESGFSWIQRCKDMIDLTGFWIDGQGITSSSQGYGIFRHWWPLMVFWTFRFDLHFSHNNKSILK